MKHFLTVSLVLLTTVWCGVGRAEGETEKLVAIGINDAYIPKGFTSDSNAYVVVNGLFPNSCYSLEEARVDHVSATQHEVRTMALVKQSICLRVLVPFTKEIVLGKLSSGMHTVRFVSDDGTSFEKTFAVE